MIAAGRTADDVLGMSSRETPKAAALWEGSPLKLSAPWSVRLDLEVRRVYENERPVTMDRSSIDCNEDKKLSPTS